MLSRIAEQVGEGVAVVDNEAWFVYTNTAFATMHGCTVEELQKTHFNASAFYTPVEWNGLVQSLIHDALSAGVGRAEVTRRRVDGTTFPAHVTLSLLRDEAGDLVGRVLCVQDITERRRVEERLRADEQRLADAQAIAGMGSWEWDVRSGALAWSAQLFTIFGRPPGWVPSYELYFAQIHPGDRDRVAEAIGAAMGNGQPFEFDHRIVLPDGSERWVHSAGDVVVDEGGQPIVLRGTAQDVTEARRSQAALEEANVRLSELATTDVLTGLPNRTLFDDRLHQAAALARRQGQTIAVLFVDLDRFKNVNDSLGHHRGDEVLVEVARRLVAVLREGDTVARLGGDEFALLLYGPTMPAAAAVAAERVIASLRPGIVSGGVEFFVGASVGVALWNRGAGSEAELLQHADVAMYRAKEAGGNRFEMFEPAMMVAARQRLDMEADLRRAVDAGEFFLRYQPQVDLRSGKVTAVEALVCWDHPLRGEMTAAEFVPLAVDTALILPIGAWALREACRQMARWRTGPRDRTPLRMAINMSARQIGAPGFVALVTGALAETGMASAELELEITEATLAAEAGPAMATLSALHAMGVGITIEGFSMGYSSMGYSSLCRPGRFPIDRLKLDMAFVAELEGNEGGGGATRALASAAIDLAHALGLEAVAEGVRTACQRDTLLALGCDGGRGSLWSEPLLAADLEPWLDHRR